MILTVSSRFRNPNRRNRPTKLSRAPKTLFKIVRNQLSSITLKTRDARLIPSESKQAFKNPSGSLYNQINARIPEEFQQFCMALKLQIDLKKKNYVSPKES